MSKYSLMIESEYIGHKIKNKTKINVADILYESNNFDFIKMVFIKVCLELVKVTNATHPKLDTDDLILGLDTGPYNFVYNIDDKVYYVDFYPPRNRFNFQNERIQDDLVITDYPKPRDNDHKLHLLKFFYTKSGLWKHAVGHLFACLDSNNNFNVQVDGFKKKLRACYEIELWKELSINNITFDKDYDFWMLRIRYYNHRIKYYSKNKDNKSKGYNISGHSIISRNGKDYIQKFYLAGDKPFDIESGQKMLNECNQFYQRLKQTEINLPETTFHLYERQAIIIAAGLGKRLGKLTENMPKMLVSINESPLINYIFTSLVNCGVTNYTTIISQKFNDKISDFYSTNYQNIENDFIIADLKGLGYALYCCKDKFKNNDCPFILTPCDIICNNGYNELFDKLKDFDIVLGVTSKQIIQEKEYTYAKIIDNELILTKGYETNSRPLNGIYAIKSPKMFFECLSQKIEKIETNEISRDTAISEGIINSKNEYRLSWIFKYLNQNGLKITTVDCGKCFEINTYDDIKNAENEINTLNRATRPQP